MSDDLMAKLAKAAALQGKDEDIKQTLKGAAERRRQQEDKRPQSREESRAIIDNFFNSLKKSK